MCLTPKWAELDEEFVEMAGMPPMPEAKSKPLWLKQKMLRKVLKRLYNPQSTRLDHHYEVGHMLGQGNTGQVYRAKLTPKSKFFWKWIAGFRGDGPGAEESLTRRRSESADPKIESPSASYAVKVIPKASLEGAAELTRELFLLSECQSENVVRFVEKFETSREVHAVMSRCYGDVQGLHDQQKLAGTYFDPELCCKWAFQLCSALAYVHDKGIVHRDVKKANLLLKSKEEMPNLLLGDFGFACKIGDDRYVQGSPLLLPPEVLLGGRQMPSGDAWAAGVTLYDIINNFHPFDTRGGGSNFPGINMTDLVEQTALDRRDRLRACGKRFNSKLTFLTTFETMAVAVTNQMFPIRFGTDRLVESPLLGEVVQRLVCRDNRMRATAGEAVECLKIHYRPVIESWI